MRYSIFAGLPLGLIVMTAIYEVATRLTTGDAALIGAAIAAALVPLTLHRWDVFRLRGLLQPPPQVFPVAAEAALDFLIPTVEQIQFQEPDGQSRRWKLRHDLEHPYLISGKLSLRTPLHNPNFVAWLVDAIDKGSKTKVISMMIELEPMDRGTRIYVTYQAPPLLDWSALEDVLRENNRWINAALLRASTDATTDVT